MKFPLLLIFWRWFFCLAFLCGQNTTFFSLKFMRFEVRSNFIFLIGGTTSNKWDSNLRDVRRGPPSTFFLALNSFVYLWDDFNSILELMFCKLFTYNNAIYIFPIPTKKCLTHFIHKKSLNHLRHRLSLVGITKVIQP